MLEYPKFTSAVYSLWCWIDNKVEPMTVSVGEKLIDDYQVTELPDHDDEFTATISAGSTTWINQWTRIKTSTVIVDEYFAELMTMKNKTWVTQM